MTRKTIFEKISKPNHNVNKPAYGSIACDINCDPENKKELALSMIARVVKYTSHYGLLFDDNSELLFSHLSFNPETRTKLENIIKDNK